MSKRLSISEKIICTFHMWICASKHPTPEKPIKSDVLYYDTQSTIARGFHTWVSHYLSSNLKECAKNQIIFSCSFSFPYFTINKEHFEQNSQRFYTMYSWMYCTFHIYTKWYNIKTRWIFIVLCYEIPMCSEVESLY